MEAPCTNHPQAPSQAQVTQEHAGSGQHQIEDWEEELSEDEVVEEEELAGVQQEIERHYQEQEASTRRQVVVQRAKARIQYIDTERARLAELRQTVNILC
jgi:hypothetical protein